MELWGAGASHMILPTLPPRVGSRQVGTVVTLHRHLFYTPSHPPTLPNLYCRHVILCPSASISLVFSSSFIILSHSVSE